MQDRIGVYVYAADPVSEAGTISQLRGQPGVTVLGASDIGDAHVAIVVAEALDEPTRRVVRAVQRNGCPRVVLVVTDLDDQSLLAAVECGVVGLLRRSAASPEVIAQAVRGAAAGDGTLPPDLLGRLLRQVRDVHERVLAPRGLSLNGLSDRETSVLRLVADGYDTREIATELAYSERTIKNVLRDVTVRFGLRNRSHAVAYALRQGLI